MSLESLSEIYSCNYVEIQFFWHAYYARNCAKKHHQLSRLSLANKVGSIITIMEERCLGTELGLAQGMDPPAKG